MQACHFFKVGQERCQGRSMIRCLVQQLADAIPGLLQKVLLVVGDMNIDTVPLGEMFER